MEKKYFNVKDRQGGWFAMRSEPLTAKEWKETALEWCYNDEYDEEADYINGLYTDKQIIEEIDNVWDITLVLYDPNTMYIEDGKLYFNDSTLVVDNEDYINSREIYWYGGD